MQGNQEKPSFLNRIQQNLITKFDKVKGYFGFCTNDLAQKCNYDLQKDELGIEQSLDENVRAYYEKIESKLEQEPKELEKEKNDYFKAEITTKHKEKFTEVSLDRLLRKIKSYNSDFEEVFYKKQLQDFRQKYAKTIAKKDKESNEKEQKAKYNQKLNKLLKILHTNTIRTWKKLIESKETKIQKQLIKDSQDELIERIKEWIELMKKFQQRFKSMEESADLFSGYIMQSLKAGMESGKKVSECVNENDLMGNQRYGGYGVGGTDNLSKRMIDFAKWLKLLEQESIKKLCDMLGKLHKAQKKIELETYTLQRTFNATIPTPYAKEEICGVTLGRDLENVLPQELTLLDDKDFSILFDLKFAENRLFCFEKQGYEDISMVEEISQEREKQVEDKKGPIILCIDTSGSMSGMPETIAKAIALFMAQRAMEARRKCYLINFSVGISTLDLTPPNGFFELMSFLEMSFSGGTDAIPALRAGLTKMNEEGYKKADLLMISDFVFSDYNLAGFRDLAKTKDKQNKCYALYVGNFSNDKSTKSILFDKEFYYDGYTHGVDELVQIKNHL